MAEQSRPHDLNEFRKTWDTSYVAKRDRFTYFREGVAQAFLAFSPEPPSDGNLDARIEMAVLPRGLISRIAVTPHKAKRTNQDVSNIAGEYVSLGLQSSGSLVGEIDGAGFAQSAGEVSLIQATKISVFALDEARPYSTTAVLFERSLLKQLPHLDDLYLMDKAYHQPIRSCLTLINERYCAASKLELTYLFDGAIALLTASLMNEQDYLLDRCENESAVRGGIVQTIKRFSRERISDPDLSTVTVADHFGISARYVQKLFATEDTTFKSYLTRTRLERVRLDLLDRSIAHINVGEIAFRWGFRDMTTFHRNFKMQFGDTPGQTRTLIRAA